MRQNYPCSKRQNEIMKTLLISVLIISSIGLKAQTPANFSGRWEFDKVNSDKDETGDASFDGKIILEINQGPDIITFAKIVFLPGKDGITLRTDSLLANGTVTKDNTGSDPAKKFVKWSQDKKVLTVNYIMTAAIDGVAQDFITAITYKLSEDGKTLTINELNKSKLNGEETIKKIYKKIK
jgi:hypothetical protein